MNYAEIALNQAGARHTYHYHIPDALEPMRIGHLVEVSFGGGRAAGIVVGLSTESPVPHTKPILDRLDPEPVVSRQQIELARWLSDQTLASLGACLWLSLPPGLARSGDWLYKLIGSDNDAYQEQSEIAPDNQPPSTLSETAGRVLSLLRERGALRGAQIDHALGGKAWRRSATSLIADGRISREPILLEPTVAVHQTRTVTLAIPVSAVDPIIAKLRPGSKGARLLQFLKDQDQPGPLQSKWLLEQTNADSAALKRLADQGWVSIGHAEAWRDPLAGREYVTVEPPILTHAQVAAWDALRESIEQRVGQAFLLHGVTGSGKTELYLRAIALAREQGRTAIALVPEIALVPQTIRRFMARFPDRVALVHSELSPGQQYDTWRRAREGLIDLVIGARSALFTPLDQIGVIVLDEEHDGSYKQSPPIPPPYYHARDVAMEMGRIYGATVILGSATPDLITSWRAKRGTIRYLQLPDRIIVHRARLAQQAAELHIEPARYQPDDAPDAMSAALPPVTVVDMRHELKAGNRSMFSRDLHSALTETLDSGAQAMLYLNRRGTASFVLCRDCGYIAKCPRCESPLTFHNHDARLTCHTCNYRAEPPVVCPECGSSRIRYFGAGTAMLEEAVAKEFPQARALRWDRDTTRERGAHEAILEQFSAGQANVLIGTQMIAKGLDIPRVTLVGVVLADTALGLPDYRSSERTFQLLTQVAGRAGRGWLGGRVILQTYQPDHYAIRAAAQHDSATFYEQEIAYRRTLGYPPFKRLARVLFRYPSEAKAQREAERAAAIIQQAIQREQLTATQIVGPAPAFFSRVNDQFRWQLLLKSSSPALALRDLVPAAGMFIDIDPIDIL